MKIELEVSHSRYNSLLGLHYIEGTLLDDKEVKHETRVISIGLLFITFSFIFIAT